MKIDHPTDYMKCCPRCGKTKPTSEWFRNSANRDGLGTYCKICEKFIKKHDYADKIKTAESKNHRLHRQTLINDLGGCCVCCGERQYEFLQIDHTKGTGGQYRKERGQRNLHISDLRNHIDELQVLCANCHLAKSYWGTCPHKEGTNEN